MAGWIHLQNALLPELTISVRPECIVAISEAPSGGYHAKVGCYVWIEGAHQEDGQGTGWPAALTRPEVLDQIEEAGA